MVIKGSARAEAGKLAAHLLRTDTNERMHVREMLGVVSPDLTEALREMEAVASAARSRRPFYHASINTGRDELMTEAQKARAIDRLEQELGLTGQPRVVVEHVKDGREHLHVAWSRIDGETLHAIPDSHNFRRHEIVARELEREFGHARVQGAHHERDGVERPERRPSHAETRQSERSGMTPEAAKDRLREIWHSADSGYAFAAALQDAGWTLAQGDKRGFVALDPTGEVRSVNKDITGLSAAKVRERMADLDAGQLPTVAAARERMRERGAPEAANDEHLAAENSASDRQETVAEPEEPASAPEQAASADHAPPERSARQEERRPKTPEEARREWADMMRDGQASVEANQSKHTTADRKDRARKPSGQGREAERQAQPSKRIKPTAPEKAARRDASRDGDRKVPSPEPGAERRAWAERLRAREKPTRKRDKASKRAGTGKAKSDQPGLFDRVRTTIRNWWEKVASPETKAEKPIDTQQARAPSPEDKSEKVNPAPKPRLQPASQTAPEPERARAAKPVRRRSVDDILAEAKAERAAETAAERLKREKQEGQQATRSDQIRRDSPHGRSSVEDVRKDPKADQPRRSIWADEMEQAKQNAAAARLRDTLKRPAQQRDHTRGRKR